MRLLCRSACVSKKTETTGVRSLSRRGHARGALKYGSVRTNSLRRARLAGPQPYRAAAFRAIAPVVFVVEGRALLPEEVVTASHDAERGDERE